MKLSEQWLRTWVNPPITSDELVAQLTMAGLEVDSSEPVSGKFQGVVVGEVVACEQHPDADRLHVCRVTTSKDSDPLTVVCGAANVQKGVKVALAQVGAILPGDVTIRRATLRGVQSEGMLCSLTELGLAESASGIMLLPEDASLGDDVFDYLQLNDHSIDIDLTPNRGDCLSVMGIAREVAAINRCVLTPPTFKSVAPVIKEKLKVELEAKTACPRYLGRIVRGIDPAASTPLWLQERLRRSGLRPISAVVDVTNYVMLEMGQPLHAFDLSHLSGTITVRFAKPGEKIQLLDEKTLTLVETSLVIADDNGPQALAGVMGGYGSGVSDTTEDVFLESAFFAPHNITLTSQRFGYHSDSSHRFERGVDPTLQKQAIERATDLLLKIAGGKPGPVVEAVSKGDLPVLSTVKLRRARVERVLGVTVADKQIMAILKRLGMQPKRQREGWQVSVPAYRFDIALEIDLIEEIARIYGYQAIPAALPEALMRVRADEERLLSKQRIKTLMVDRGYREAVTYAFSDPALEKLLVPDCTPILLSNPIASDMAAMRTSLLPGLLRVALYNQNRQQDRIRLFEIGVRFLKVDDKVVEEPVLAGLVMGCTYQKQWGLSASCADFFDVKSDTEALLRLSGYSAFRFEPKTHPALHPGKSASLMRGDETVGMIGVLHPSITQSLDLHGPVVLFEYKLFPIQTGLFPEFKVFSRFPSVRRDIAIVLDEGVAQAQIDETIWEALGAEGKQLLHHVQLFDVYQGEGVDVGKKSMALGLTFQHASRTLVETEINALIDKVLAALHSTFSATLRG